MKFKLAAALPTALFCASLAAFPVLAKAQSSRLYFAGYFGLNVAQKSNFTETTTNRSGDIGGNNSFAFAGALGVRLDRHWRLEGELSYRSEDISSVSDTDDGVRRAGGNVATGLAMINAYYDFDTSWKNLTPFITAGLGVASHSVDFRDSAGFLPSATDSSYGFAYQAGAGLKFRMSDAVSLTGSYRYIGTSNMETDSYDFDYGSHEVRFGIQYDIPPTWFK
jgi:opacity protein-like surface antigen